MNNKELEIGRKADELMNNDLLNSVIQEMKDDAFIKFEQTDATEKDKLADIKNQYKLISSFKDNLVRKVNALKMAEYEKNKEPQSKVLTTYDL